MLFKRLRSAATRLGLCATIWAAARLRQSFYAK